jgi:hypothetical protein
MMRKHTDEKIEKTQSQIKSLYEEIGLLSKKSPNMPLNKFKIRFINSIISDANKLLTEKNKPLKEFESFNEDDLPNNSDVVMILAQYLGTINDIYDLF